MRAATAALSSRAGAKRRGGNVRRTDSSYSRLMPVRTVGPSI
jgi:hypothetical protein